MTTSITPLGLRATGTEFSESEREVLGWLTQEDDESLKRRMAQCEEAHSAGFRAARFLNALSDFMFYPVVLSGFALLVHIFIRFTTLSDLQLKWVPGIGATFLAFLVCIGIVWVIDKLRKLRHSPDWYNKMVGLSERSTGQRQILRRLAGRSGSARAWYSHVCQTRQGNLRALDEKMMQMLAERDRRAGEPTARERLYRYPTWVGVADSTMTPKALLEEVEEFASKRRLPASKLHELLVDSDDVLSRKLEEAQRTLDESSVQQKKPNALVRLCRMLVHKGAFAMYAGFACVAAPGLWRIVTLSETPLALQTLAILGVTLWVTVVAAGFVWAHNMPEEDTPAASRVSELTVLDNGECWDMLQYLRESPSARAWHHHVTHTQMRRFRQIDLKLLEALIVFERVRVEVAST